MQRRQFILFIIIGVSCIVQTMFHLSWTVMGLLWSFCHSIPRHYGTLVFYITYFYQHKCGPMVLDSYFYNTDDGDNFIHGYNASSLYLFVKDVIGRAILPQEAEQYQRTLVYFLAFAISDCVWILTSILFLAGIFYYGKKVYFFNVPWLVSTAWICLLDVTAGVHYGFDMQTSHTIETWLQFVGIKNFNDFQEYESIDGLIPEITSLVIVSLSTRFFFVWIFNIIAFCYVFNTIIILNLPKKANTLPATERIQAFNNHSQSLNLNTSEARIRNWQLFYGATEVTAGSTTTSESSDNPDFNCNTKAQHNPLTMTQSLSFIEPPVNDGFYQKYPDVADNITISPNVHMKPLRNQRPWTYVSQIGGASRFNEGMLEESVTNL